MEERWILFCTPPKWFIGKTSDDVSSGGPVRVTEIREYSFNWAIVQGTYKDQLFIVPLVGFNGPVEMTVHGGTFLVICRVGHEKEEMPQRIQAELERVVGLEKSLRAEDTGLLV